jgi:LPXTG-site transpeptidase (sortase) family protein
VVFERFELLAWIGVLATLAVMSVFVIRAVGAERVHAQLSVRFQPAVGPSPWPTAVTTGDAPCVFTNCTRPQLVGPPVRIRIGSLGVDAGLEDLALDSQGQLAAPKSYVLAGWYADGVAPGDPGPAVIAGHVDSVAGPAVFYRLHELQAGDAIEVLRGDAWTTFRVTTTERYPKDQFPSERVYRPTPDAELRLITCGGDFDAGRQSYRDNIVVYAVVQ